MADLASWDDVFASVEQARPTPKEPESWDDVDATIKEVEAGFNPEYLKELKTAEAVAQTAINEPPFGTAEWALAAKVPPEYQRAALERSAELFKDRGPMKGRGDAMRTAVSLVQGGIDWAMPAAEFLAPKELQLTPEQERFRQALGEAREGNDPSRSAGWIAANIQSIARMAPPMMAMGSAGRATGAIGKSFGLGTKGVAAAQGVGVAASAYPMASDQSYRSLIAEGVDPKIAAPVSRVSGVLEGIIETIVPDPFKAQAGVLKGTISRIVTEGARRLGVQAGRIGLEAFEEGSQAFTREAVAEVARAIDEKVPNQGLGPAFVAAADDFMNSLVPLAGIMSPSMAIGAVGTARNTAARPQQYQDAIERRDFELFRRELAKSAAPDEATPSVASPEQDADVAQKLSTLDKPPGAHKWAEVVLGDRRRFKEAPDEATRTKLWEQSRTATTSQQPPLPQGVPDASQVPTNERSNDVQGDGREGSQIDSGSQVRVEGQEQVGAKQTSQEPTAQEVPVDPLKQEEDSFAQYADAWNESSAKRRGVKKKPLTQGTIDSLRTTIDNHADTAIQKGKVTKFASDDSAFDDLEMQEIQNAVRRKGYEVGEVKRSSEGGTDFVGFDVTGKRAEEKPAAATEAPKPVDPVSERDQAEDELAGLFGDEPPQQTEATTATAKPTEQQSAPRVYREMAADELDSIINPNTSSGETFGGTERFWSDNPDLAIGQGTNKGFVVELDPSGLKLQEHAKPGTAIPGVGKDFTTRHRANEFRPGIRSITIKPGAAGTSSAIRVKKLLETEVKAGRWSKSKAEGGEVVYRPSTSGTSEKVGTKPTTGPTENQSSEAPAEAQGELRIPASGKPFTFTALHNKEKSPKMGARFGQDKEPAGRYVVAVNDDNTAATDMPDKYDRGAVTFENPLVIEFGGGYQESTNWKQVLSERYGGLTGKALSEAVRKDGYDGIVTVEPATGPNRPAHTAEIVDLRQAPKPTVKIGRKGATKKPSPEPTGAQDTGTSRGQSGEQVGSKPAESVWSNGTQDLPKLPPSLTSKPELAPDTAKPPADEPIPKFTRTTPGKGSTTRQLQAELVEKARADIADLEKKARAKRSEHDGLRSNATKKRAAVRKEIESFNRMIQKTQGEIASDMAADTLAKLEDELESPKSYDHYLAGMRGIHRLKAGVAEDAARRGEMGRQASIAVVEKEQKEADRLDAELQSRAKDIAKSQGFTSGDADQIALSASNGFTIFEDRSLADVVEVQGKRTRESRVSQEINKLKPEQYGRKDLSDEQIAEFTKQYQEASLDDKNWLAKRLVVDTAVKDAIEESRAAVRKREDDERKVKEEERAKEEQEALTNARERAKKYFLDERISKALKKQKPKTKPVMVRVEEGTGKRIIVEGKITEADQKGELYPNGLILHKSFDEDSRNDFAITHAGSGLGFPFIAKKSAMQELIGLVDLLGIDFNVATDEKGALPSELASRMKKINTAWDNNDYSMLSEQDYATVQALAEVAKTDIDADLILTADDLGANGIPPGLGNVMTDKGLGLVKQMAIAVPEFPYDPVFTVKDGKLLYRDGFEFKLEPTAFNLHPSELKEGQTVGINLEDLGIKRFTPQDVVAEMMKQAGLPRVTKNKGGDVSVGYVGATPTSLQQGKDDNEWNVVGGTPKVQEMAVAVLKKIRWRQLGQDGDPKTDLEINGKDVDSQTTASKPQTDSLVVDEPQATDSVAADNTKRIQEIDKELDQLQSQYEKKMSAQSKSAMVPPSIKGDALSQITKKMDKLDAEKALLQKPTEKELVATSKPVPETPKAAPVQAEFMEMSNGVNAPGVKQTIQVTAGDRTLLMEKGKADNEWSIREGEKYTGEVKGKTAVKKGGELIVSGIVETKKAKEIAQRIIDGTFDKDSDKRFVREDTQNIGLTNGGIAEAMKNALGGRRDSFAKLLREEGLVTDGRFLLKVSDKDRDAILKAVGQTFEGKSLSTVAKMMSDGRKALSRQANAMKPIGYRGGYLTPRIVVLQSQDGDAAIFDKSLHDTILKKYPNAVPYFYDAGGPISYASNDDVIAIVMPINMEKPDAKFKDLVAGKYDFEAEAAEAAKFPPPQSKTKLKKAAEKANQELADAEKELGKLIGGKSGLAGSLPIFHPTVIAAAAKVVAKAIKPVHSRFAELMERMITKYGEAKAEQMRAVLQQEWDKQASQAKQPEPIPETESNGETTGTKHAKTDELRAKHGFTERVPPTPETFQEWEDEARRKYPNAEARLQVVELAERHPERISKIENAAIGQHIVDLENRRKEGEDVLDELLRTVKASTVAGSEAGRALVSRKAERYSDFSLAGIVNQHIDSVGEDPNDEQMQKYAEAADKISKLEEELDALKKKLAQAEVDRAIAEAAAGEKPKLPKLGTKKATLQKKASEAVASFKAEWATLSQLGAISDPKQQADKWIKITKAAGEVIKSYAELGIESFLEVMASVTRDMGKLDKYQVEAFKEAWQTHKNAKVESPLGSKLDDAGIGRMARELTKWAVQFGIEEREAVIDVVHQELQGMGIDISRSETMAAMSGYGDFRELSKDEVSVKARGIKGEIQQLLKLEDMQSGQAPAKTGVERRDPTDEERRLTKLVNEAKKKGGYEVTDPDRQLKTALGTAKTAIRNRIADLEKEIESREKIVKERTPLKEDAELVALREKRDALQKEHRKIFPPTKTVLTDAQRLRMAEALLDRQIDELTEDLNAERLEAKNKRPSLTSAVLDAKKAELKRLKEIREQAREASPEYQAKMEAKRNAQYKKTLEKQLEFWESRRDEASKGNLPEKRKTTIPTDKAILEKKWQIEQVKREARAEIEHAERAARSSARKALGFGGDLLDFARAVQTGYELSATLRQGAFYTLGFPKQAIPALLKSIEAAFSKRADFALHDDLMKRPNHLEYMAGKLETTAADGPLSHREEALRSRIASWLSQTEGWKWAVPRWAAEGLLGSERAFRSFSNTMRADLFDYMKASVDASRPGTWSEDDAKVLGSAANTISGRPQMEHAVAWGRVLYAPRWVWSRALLAVGQPLWKGDKATRLAVGKVYVRAALGMVAFQAIKHLFYWLAADDDDHKPKYEIDPRSSDFAKTRLGDTRLDSGAGINQLAVLAARLATGQTKRQSGEIVDIRGDNAKYGADDTVDVMSRFLRTKLAPLPSGVIDWIAGENVVGEKTSVGKIIGDRLMPMTWSDIWDAEKELNVPQGTVAAIEAFLGTGVSTYGDKSKYRAASTEERSGIIEKDLKNLDWDSPPPAYAEFLNEEQSKQFEDRKHYRFGSKVNEATGKPESESSIKARDEAIADIKSSGWTYEEAKRAMIDYWESTNTTKDSKGKEVKGKAKEIKDGRSVYKDAVQKRITALRKIYESK
jgi:hypothetical protein